MEDLSIFSTLLNYPIFNGLGRIDLEGVVSQTRFDFRKVAAGKTIAVVDSVCDKVFFLLSGTVEIIRNAADHGYVITEKLSAPMLFQTECLFGYQRRFTHTFIAHTPVSIMTIDRDEVMKFMETYPVVRMNVINQLAESLLKERSVVWKHQYSSLTDRLIAFISNHLIYKAGEKQIKIKMVRLAHELNASRLDVSKALNTLNDLHMIKLGRGGFIVPKMELLLNYKSVIV
ncbi:MAG: cyclic nucleotide-binding domain-containing protein [Bacteroidaceae bacterium]|nr:cyclic nucleotide-binding domain-containing protein [Bacteroidaceae bacterium]